MAEPRFQEDFFQRIQDVNWEAEPDCFFMAGVGGRMLGSNPPFGGGDIWRSDDGIHWSLCVENLHHNGSTSCGLYSGFWMRQNLDLKGLPVWVLGGIDWEDDREQEPHAMVAVSFDGSTIEKVFFGPSPDYPTGVYVRQMELNAPNGMLASEVYNGAPRSTTTGTSWALEGGGQTLLTARAATADLVLSSHTIGEQAPIIQPAAIVAPPTITPFAINPQAPPENTHRYYQLSNRGTVFGKVKVGPYKGKTIRMEGKFGELVGEGTYFHPELTVSDAKTGEALGTCDTGIERGSSLAYGNYVFAACGRSSGNSNMAYTVNGRDWVTTRLSDGRDFWSLCVGPRR